MAEYLQVVTTTETREHALTVARETVRARAAACAQVIGPITSVFHWKGRIEEAGEYLCVMKTLSETYESLEKTIREFHAYEVPEIIALPIEKGGPDYLAWLKDEVKRQEREA
ncbi:MAG: divalent-cation tolerance protein CutA [Desulfatiglandales bacterium]